jgi:hypothetical protein
MRIIFSSNKEKKLQDILNRTNLISKNETDENNKKIISSFMQIMVAMQCIQFLMKPWTRKKDLFRLCGIRQSEEPTKYDVQIPPIVDEEFKKSKQQLWSDEDKTRVNEDHCLEELVLLMIYYDIKELDGSIEESDEPIKELDEPKEKRQKYNKQDFKKMASIISKFAVDQELMKNIEPFIKDYDLNKEHLIYYILLSSDFSKDVSKETAVTPQYIKKLLTLKIKSIEDELNEAQNSIYMRDIARNFVKSKFKNSDIVAMAIRDYINNGEKGIPNETYCSIEELNREAKKIFKEHN